MKKESRYHKIIEHVFFERFKEGDERVPFERTDFAKAAQTLGIKLPKNLGDVIYSYRYRKELPESVDAKAPEGKDWIIRGVGVGQYCFVAVKRTRIAPNEMMAAIKVPDATPGVIALYALNDEQALLAKLRYNRLIDIFTRVTCYSLQSHLRTMIANIGQVETDEVYVGVDRKGIHYVFPVQAKGGRDRLSIVQVDQDMHLCLHRFPSLVCRPIGAQFIDDDTIVLFEFVDSGDRMEVLDEKHYRLVPPEEMKPEDIELYRARGSEGAPGGAAPV